MTTDTGGGARRAPLADTIQVARRVLDSGLTVIVVRRPHVHSVALGAFLRVGSRYETRAELGLAHFLEHLLFRGSSRHADSIDLSRAVERLGGYIDAGVHQEMTDYIVDVHRDHWCDGIGLLGELLLEPTFSEEQVEIERAILVEEMGQYTDSRGENVNLHELAYQLLWGDELAQIDMGILHRNLSTFDRARVLRFYEHYYTAGNTVVVVVGDIEPEAAFDRVGEVFAGMSGPRVGEFRAIDRHKDRAASIVRYFEGTQVDLCVAMRSYPLGHADYPASAVLAGVLGGGAASRLFQRVREERGLVYDVRADVETFRDVGAITVSTYCGEQNTEPTLTAVFDTLDEIRESGVTEEELERARCVSRASADFLLDNPLEICDWFGRVETLDSPDELPDPRREAQRYLKVEMADLERVVADVCRPSNRYLAVIGPVRARQKRRVEDIFRRRAGKAEPAPR